jgi:hypothetical protein
VSDEWGRKFWENMEAIAAAINPPDEVVLPMIENDKPVIWRACDQPIPYRVTDKGRALLKERG